METHDGSSAEENTNPSTPAKKLVKPKSEPEEDKEKEPEKKKEKKPRSKRESESGGKERKEKEPKAKKKKVQGPMHFTANNEPRALDVLGDLDPAIFNEVCIFFGLLSSYLNNKQRFLFRSMVTSLFKRSHRMQSMNGGQTSLYSR